MHPALSKILRDNQCSASADVGTYLSIVMQGPVLHDGRVDNDFVNNVKITRTNYPKAEMIVSTWSCSSEMQCQIRTAVEDYNVILVWSQDPGPLTCIVGRQKYFSNVNRLLLSSQFGIRRASREVVIKMRTDTVLVNDNLQRIYKFFKENNFYQQRDPQYQIFKNRIINCNLFSRDARGYIPFLFHPGDIVMIGNREDILDFFSAPCVTTHIFGLYTGRLITALMRYFPEQYYWVNCIEQKIKNSIYSGNGSHSEMDVEKSERYFVSNFIPFSDAQIGMVWKKYEEVYHRKGKWTVYFFEDWVSLYEKYILGIKPEKNKVRLVKKFVQSLMIPVFLIRTHLLRISWVRSLAVLIFVKHREY